ncbi:MAG TPA: hypothetical protein VN605_01780, partial [Thermoanaerobaculia bacterium]|nr:hypothetical protein [Thermoanaerobaculia bacterium]
NAERCLVITYAAQNEALAMLLSPSGQTLQQVPVPRLSIAGTDDHGFLLTGVTKDFHALRIDNGGGVTFDTIVQHGDIPVSSADFDGEQYSLIWSNHGEDRSIYAMHITLAGVVEPPRRLRDDAPFGSEGVVVWNGREHVYAYTVSGFGNVIPEIAPETTPYLQFLDRDLAPIGAPRELQHTKAGTNFGFQTAVNGGAAYLAWQEGFGFFAALSTIHGALVAADRSVVRTGGFHAEPLPQFPQAIAATADTTVAVWSDADLNRLDPLDFAVGPLWFTRFTRSGVSLDAQPRLLAEFAVSVAASTIGSDVLVVWHRGRETPQPMEAAIVHTADGTFDHYSLPLTDFAGILAVATNGNSWLIVAGRSLLAISRTGMPLTPAAVRYRNLTPSSIALASDGSRYLLTWEDDTEQHLQGSGPARFAIINGDGTIAVPEQTVHPTAFSVAATFTGREYLVASTDPQTTRVSRVSTSGEVLATSTVPVSGDPRLELLGNGVLLTSRRGTAVVGARLTAEGTVVDAQPFVLPFVPNVTARTPQRTIVNLRTITAPGAAARAAV